MSEYQYYEFCRVDTPLPSDVRQKMSSLSSRAKVTTHGASYVYNYGDFPGVPKELLSQYFDVFFYISNWGCMQLIFKYSTQEIDVNELEKYYIEDVVGYDIQSSNIILNICFSNEDGFGWVEGEGMLTELLPLYYEIKAGNYQFLQLLTAINDEDHDKICLDSTKLLLSDAQKAFFKHAMIDQSILNE